MRKNNDGYVIIYVIFVILFLCIVAVGTCSSALSNLQNQNRAVEQMQERYEAQGEVEKQVAELCAVISANVKIDDENAVADVDTDADSKIIELFKETEVIVVPEDNILKVLVMAGDLTTVEAKVEFLYTINSLRCGEEIVYKKDDDGNEITDDNGEKIEETRIPLYSYTVSVTSHYTSYTIENTGGDAA